MKVRIEYLCELCQKPIAHEKIHSFIQDILIPYNENRQFCPQCKREMEMMNKNTVLTPTFWNG